MLSKLFKGKSKLTDADPARRREAVAALDESEQAVLEEVARSDADVGVRIAAVARLRSAAALGALLDDAALVDAAADRLLDVGVGHELADHPTVRIARFLRAPALDLLERLADPTLAALAITRIHDFDTRFAVANEIWDESRLIALELATRNRDKAVHRLARDRLSRLKSLAGEQAELVAHAESLIATAERMTPADDQFEARRDAIARQWDVLQQSLATTMADLAPYGHAADPVAALSPRFHLPKVPETPDEEPPSPNVEAFVTLLAELSALDATIAEDPEAIETTAAFRSQLTDVQTRWSEHADKEPAPDTEAVVFRDHCHHLNELIEALDRANQYKAAAAEMIALDTVFRPPKTDSDYAAVWQLQSDSRRQARAAVKLVAAVNWPSNLKRPEWINQLAEKEATINALDEHCHDTFSAVQTRLSESLDAMERAIENGEINEAAKLQARTSRWIHRLPKSAQKSSTAKLAGRSARLRELTDWQTFAEHPKREALCAQIEAIADNPLPAEEQIARIKDLRAHVNTLGRIRSAADRALMERFNIAAERAFEPCRRHFEALAKQRKFNLEQRETICKDLEMFLEQNDWENADYRGVDQILREARAEWRTYHPVDRSPGKRVDARFKVVTDKIFEHLKLEWDRNVDVKQAIVDEARSAVEADKPMSEQIDLMKRLQGDWKRVGITPRRVDQRLWTDFRGICDDVFEARDADRNDRRSRTTAAIGEADALIEELRRTITEGAPEQNDRRVVNTYRAKIEALGRLPAEVDRRVQRALSDLEREAALRASQQRLRDELARLDKIDALDAKLAGIEREQGATDAWMEEAGELRAMFASRLDCALPADLEALQRLAIEAEIAAEVESPEADTALRLEIQVGRLKSGLGARASVDVDADTLLDRWCVCASEQTGAAEVRSRFFSAVRQLVER